MRQLDVARVEIAFDARVIFLALLFSEIAVYPTDQRDRAMTVVAETVGFRK